MGFNLPFKARGFGGRQRFDGHPHHRRGFELFLLQQ
jgi:hypothetical protein